MALRISLLFVSMWLLAFAGWSAGPGMPDPGFGSGGWVQVEWGIATTVTGVAEDDAGRLLVAGSSSGGAFDVSRLLPGGGLDVSFGIAGRAMVVLSGATELNVAKILALPGGSSIVVGDAEFSSGRWAFGARLDPVGSLDPAFGSAGLIYWQGNNNPTFVSDADLSPDGHRFFVAGHYSQMGTLTSLFRGFLTASGVSPFSQMTTTGASAAAPEIRILGTSSVCWHFLRSSNSAVHLWTGAGPLCQEPLSSVVITLPQAPAAALRVVGMAPAANGDLFVAVWAESGLPTQPTVVLRLDPDGDLVTEWSGDGRRFVDATAIGYGGFRATHLAMAPGGVELVGTELGLGANVDRVGVVRLLEPWADLDPAFPTAGAVSIELTRDHQVADGLRRTDGRLVAAVLTTPAIPGDDPHGWVVTHVASSIFEDGFEAGSAVRWSAVVP